MNRKHTPFMPVLALFAVLGLLAGTAPANAQAPALRQRPLQNQELTPVQSDTSRNLSLLFDPATSEKIAPDAKGFIRRWLILEPVKKNISTNRVFTDNFIRTNFTTDNFSTDFTIVPQQGKTVKIGDQVLKWHALDSKLYHVKLFRFAYALDKPLYGVLYWVVTVINCPEEIKNVRMTAGVNSGGMFWLNGKEVIMLSGDRDMIVDDCASPRLTLKKGKNIIRGGIINGPGMSDFCVRFLDEKLQPVTNFTLSCD